MSLIKELLEDDEFRQFEQDMRTMADLELEYSEEELDDLFEKFGVKD